MESKGRRAVRAAARGAVPAETANFPLTTPGAGNSVEAPAEKYIPAEVPVEVVTPIETVAPAPRVVAPAAAGNSSLEESGDFGREVFAALVQSQTAVARGLEALSAEVTGMVISGIDAATRAANEMLGVKTLSDAIEVNAGFTRSSFDTLLSGSAKLSELGMKLATEASHPIILTQLGRSWVKAACRAF